MKFFKHFCNVLAYCVAIVTFFAIGTTLIMLGVWLVQHHLFIGIVYSLFLGVLVVSWLTYYPND